MILTRDLADIVHCRNIGPHLTRFVYAMSMVGMNLMMQVSIVYWVNLYVVGESVWMIQGDYAQFHHDVFDKDGTFSLETWKSWDGPRDSLCGAVLTKTIFLSVILFLWSGRMLGELKQCLVLRINIANLPSAPASAQHHDTILERDDQHLVLAMTPLVRVTLYVIVIIPKACICILLWYIGLRWLTSTIEFSNLILNALALEFILRIDEQILEFFLPPRATANVSKTKFAYPKEDELTKEEELASMQSDYNWNIFYFFLCLSLTLVYLNFLQQVLPSYPFDVGEHCGKWFEERFLPRCHPFERNCFPFGDVKEPHKYGEQSVGS